MNFHDVQQFCKRHNTRIECEPFVNPLTHGIGLVCPAKFEGLQLNCETSNTVVKLSYSTEIARVTFFSIMSIPLNSIISKL